MVACIVHLIRNTFPYAARRYWDELSRDPRPIYTAPFELAAKERFMEFPGKWGKQYRAVIRLWENARPHRQRQDTMDPTMEAGAQRFRHQLRRKNQLIAIPGSTESRTVPAEDKDRKVGAGKVWDDELEGPTDAPQVLSQIGRMCTQLPGGWFAAGASEVEGGFAAVGGRALPGSL